MSFRRIFLALILCFILFLSFLFLTLPHDTVTPVVPTPSPTTSPPPTLAPSHIPETLLNRETEILITETPTYRETETYIVQSGDTLELIARTHGVSWLDLANLNQIENPNLLSIGQEIIILPVGADPRVRPQGYQNIDPYYIDTIKSFSTSTIDDPQSTKRIFIVLSEQKLYTYEGKTKIGEYLISSGVAAHPTVVGEFKIWIKLESTLMSGEDYYLPNVPYTMYFYDDYGIHGTYWHSNFGTPMSHGCINMKTEDAEIIFNWAQVGTIVDIVP